MNDFTVQIGHRGSPMASCGCDLKIHKRGGGGNVNLHFNDFMRSHSRIKILKVIQPSLHCSGILRLWTLSGASF